MSMNKSCTNCPGATDHDTAHCPLFLLRERLRLNEELPPKWYILVLRELDAFIAELRDACTEEAEGAQGERGCGHAACKSLGEPHPFCKFVRDQDPQAHAALAQPSPAPQLCQHCFGHGLNDPAGSEPCPLCKAPELERPEVVEFHMVDANQLFDLIATDQISRRVDGEHLGAMGATEVTYWNTKLGLVLERKDSMAGRSVFVQPAQHDRIVGTLRDELTHALSARDAYGQNAIDMQAQRDAAQARVAELEKQEPVAYSFRFAGCVTSSGPECWRNELDRERPAQFLFDDGRVKDFQPLYAAPVAQAGQVPEVFAVELNGKLVEVRISQSQAQEWADAWNASCPNDAQVIGFARIAAAPAQGE